MNYSENAINVFKKLYYKKDGKDSNILLENHPNEVFERVARFVAGDNGDRWYGDFYDMMKDGYFRPCTPCMMNAGVTAKPQTAACFVGDLQDDLMSIFDFDKESGIIFAKGSGIGGNFGALREKDALLSSGGQSSGPFSFMKKWAATAEAVKSGGSSRRAAQMAMFHDTHPDLLEFITFKDGVHLDLRSMNLSIAASNAFMEAVEGDLSWKLYGVSDKEVKSTHKAKDVFDKIITNAHKTGDPGLWFIDRANKDNGLIDQYGRYTSTNPCVVGETLVAVADGRGYVSIEQLAKESKDIPVHSVDLTTRRPAIKMGRNPRKTRANVPILKITFDDGSFIRTTEDHNFLDYDGNKVKAIDLQPKQQLLSFIKFQNPNTTTGKMYWNIINRDGNRGQIAEHQLVMDFNMKYPGDGYIPHHKNGNSLDNTPSNLEWITIGDHNRLEPTIYSGEGTNPMFGKSHSEKTKKLIGEKSRKRNESEKYRIKCSDSIKKAMSRPEVIAKMSGEKIERVEVPCAYCGEIRLFTPIAYKSRLKQNKMKEVFCSVACSAKWISENVDSKPKFSINDALSFGIRYTNEIGKMPTYRGWDLWSKKQDNICSREWIRIHFGGFPDFKKELSKIMESPNHKVISVQKDGIADVYNITVDDTHTVAYITNTDGKTVKKGNPKLWGIYTTNCGEIPGLPYSACALASINLAKFVWMGDNKDVFFDWDDFKRVVRLGIIFLDRMIDISGYPTEKYEEMAKNTRPLGLGIMGLADMLCKLGIPYNSKEAYALCDEISMTLTKEAINTSEELGEEFGSFPDFEANRHNMQELCRRFGYYDAGVGIPTLRNSNWTTIAPTGTISISADCSPGMEPLFGICYTKNISDSNEKWIFVNPVFEEKYSKEPWYQEAISEIAKNGGSCQKVDCVPVEVKRVWVTAHDIHWKDRIEMQAALQKNISSAISSTINLPSTATVDEIKEIYMLAWKKGLKGITVYRDGSLDSQPVEFKQENKEEKIDLIRNRPKIRNGTTYTMETGHGSIHITINKDMDENVFELFAAGGKGGNVNAASLEAVGRLSSLALQKGAEVKEVAKQLLGISDGRVTWDKIHPDDDRTFSVLSIWDAIGQVLNRFYSVVKKDPVVDSDKKTKKLTEQLRCPDCGADMFMVEGCPFCNFCGSKCS
jgi:ribonucleotide reductase alpha subunit